MGHFAKVVDGFVTQVIVAEPDFFDTFVDDSPGNWVQTSYNTSGNQHSNGGTPLRKNYAGIGFHYDGVGFYEPKPYASWVLDDDTYLWGAPISRPSLTDEQVADGKYYYWDEEAHQADNSTGWVLGTISQ